MSISGGFQLQKQYPNLYQSLLKTKFDADIGNSISFSSVTVIYILHSFFIVESIKIDLPRTFPDNIFFENIKLQLFNVLTAYAHHNRDVGYCQGLNYIAGNVWIDTILL